MGDVRGRQIAAHVINEGRVDDNFKREAGCDCAAGVDDIFCHECVRKLIYEVESNGRQDADFTNSVAAVLNADSSDPTHDPSVLWDAFDEGMSLAVDDILEKMLPADSLMTMAQRTAALDRDRGNG